MNKVLEELLDRDVAAAEGGRGGEAALRLADRDRAARVRHRVATGRSTFTRRYQRYLINGLPRGVGLPGRAAAAQVHQPGHHAVTIGALPWFVLVVPARRDPHQPTSSGAVPRGSTCASTAAGISAPPTSTACSAGSTPSRSALARHRSRAPSRSLVFAPARCRPSLVGALLIGVAAVVGHVLLAVRRLQGRQGRRDGRRRVARPRAGGGGSAWPLAWIRVVVRSPATCRSAHRSAPSALPSRSGCCIPDRRERRSGSCAAWPRAIIWLHRANIRRLLAAPRIASGAGRRRGRR